MYAIVGPSGAGKTTFVDVCLGLIKPTSGEVIEIDSGIRYAYVPQHTHLSSVSLKGNVAIEWDDRFINDDLADTAMHQALIENVFDGRKDDENSSAMSGGQMQRIGIARALYRKPNFLVLDEPTNHLDMATKEMLISALAAYEGTMLFVSHDRHFLAALSNRVLELTPEGIHDFAGGYTEYVARTGQEAPGLRS
jgi:ATPase subunit of ABC transporter with duplicated ATPase domains